MIKSKSAGSKGRQSEIRDRIENNKNADLKGPTVTQLIMNRRRKMERGIRNAEETERSCVGGGNLNDLLFCLNTRNLEVRRELFPWKNL